MFHRGRSIKKPSIRIDTNASPAHSEEESKMDPSEFVDVEVPYSLKKGALLSNMTSKDLLTRSQTPSKESRILHQRVASLKASECDSLPHDSSTDSDFDDLKQLHDMDEYTADVNPSLGIQNKNGDLMHDSKSCISFTTSKSGRGQLRSPTWQRTIIEFLNGTREKAHERDERECTWCEWIRKGLSMYILFFIPKVILQRQSSHYLFRAIVTTALFHIVMMVCIAKIIAFSVEGDITTQTITFLVLEPTVFVLAAVVIKLSPTRKCFRERQFLFLFCITALYITESWLECRLADPDTILLILLPATANSIISVRAGLFFAGIVLLHLTVFFTVVLTDTCPESSASPEGVLAVAIIAAHFAMFLLSTLSTMYSKQTLHSLQSALRKYRTVNEDLLVAKEAAEKSNETKNRFLSNISHEMNTPMNGILGGCAMLQNDKDRSHTTEYVYMIRSCAQTLHDELTDILVYSKLEAGVLHKESVPFSLFETMEHVLDQMARAALYKGVDILFEPDPELPLVLEDDPVLFGQLFRNVLANAIKFTHEGSVSIITTGEKISNERMCLCMDIVDTGIGITDLQKNVIFDSFAQGSTAANRSWEGAGLGLSIARKLCEMLDGSIECHSKGIGFGTTFRIVVELGTFTGKKDPGLHIAFPWKFSPKIPLQSRPKCIVWSRDVGRKRALQKLCLTSGAPTHVAVDRIGIADLVLELEGSLLLVVDIGLNYDPTIKSELLKLLQATNAVAAGPRMVLALCCAAGAVEELVADEQYQQLKEHIQCIQKPVLYTKLASVIRKSGSRRTRSISASPSATLTPNLPSEFTILIVDDHDINLKVARRIVEKLGYNAIEASNGTEAVRVAFDVHVDMILMDVFMPGMDGREATSLIRAREANEERHAVPIFAITANSTAEDKQQCLNSGMNGYFSKPFTPQKLHYMIHLIQSSR